MHACESQEKAHRLAKAVYRLEVEKRDLRSKSLKVDDAGDGASLVEEVATLKLQLDQQRLLLLEYQRKLRIASGR